MAKHVKSDDPRKPAIVAALKKASGGSKVTMVAEVATNTFRGDCLAKQRGGKGYTQLGTFTVSFAGTPEASGASVMRYKGRLEGK